MKRCARGVIALAITGVAATASAAPTPAAPTGAHPRMLLDAELRAAWKAAAGNPKSAVAEAIALCDKTTRTRDFNRSLYQGSEWARALEACLVAWVADGSDAHAATSIKFFTALIDDLDTLGDGKGGDDAASRDSGYAIRNLGPWTALAYDWLYDKIAPDVRERARRRWKAWLDHFETKGYRPHTPGSNYHAGYLLSATMAAIAEAGESSDAAALWTFVVERMWGKEMLPALGRGGVLEGGDWPEGWQYGPLAIASYALTARLLRHAGVATGGVDAWLDGVMRRYVYALTPGDRVWPGGDSEDERPNRDVSILTLDAISFGDAPADDRRWARAELARMPALERSYSLFWAALGSVAPAGEAPAAVPRASWPLWYLAPATGDLYARTSWDATAVWAAFQCSRTIDTDHRHADAGNFAVSRGKDDVVVDPSPYGSLSSLTGNAPTAESAQYTDEFRPSQGKWGQANWDWTVRTAGGVIAARCDYAETFKYRDRRSDVPDALRAFVWLPGDDAKSAVIVVFDLATTAGAEHAMFLRVRTPGELAAMAGGGDAAMVRVGDSQLAIAMPFHTPGTVGVDKPRVGDCFGKGTTRGGCDLGRFAVSELAAKLTGPKPRAATVVAVGDPARAATIEPLQGDGQGVDWTGVQLGGIRDAVVVWPMESAKALSYKAKRGASVTHVVLPGPKDHKAPKLTVHADGDACAVDVAPASEDRAGPTVITVGSDCTAKSDAMSAPPSSSMPAPYVEGAGSGSGTPRHHRFGGCCDAGDAGGSPASPLVLATLVGVALVPLRRRAGS